MVPTSKSDSFNLLRGNIGYYCLKGCKCRGLCDKIFGVKGSNKRDYGFYPYTSRSNRQVVRRIWQLT